ncbi:LPD29 domain-containing protein [Streptomyces sp. NPDC021100]|uniref:LPD29 domain-containing protein n=1 Tax=Streptomyces sp. NPDC021100 TaxID=3365114 RepID=UPI0037AFDB29
MNTALAEHKNAAYLALRLPAGTQVTYHGTLADAHGQWTVHPCSCRRCSWAVWRERPATRYELRAVDGSAPGPVHVRHTSVTPVPSRAELNEAAKWLSTKYVAVHLRKELRRAFPGVKFSVRTGQGGRWSEITVRWSGGPNRTAVGAVVAPLRAHYGNDGRCRPRPITVTVGGRTASGAPMVSAIHLARA